MVGVMTFLSRSERSTEKGEVPMPKVLCLSGAAVAVLVLLLFGIDLAAGFPFDRISLVMDIGLIICSLVLGYTSWTTFRQLG